MTASKKRKSHKTVPKLSKKLHAKLLKQLALRFITWMQSFKDTLTVRETVVLANTDAAAWVAVVQKVVPNADMSLVRDYLAMAEQVAIGNKLKATFFTTRG